MNIYKDIPRLTEAPNYRVNLSWGFLESHFQRWEGVYLLDYEPDFQRGHVWTEDQQIRYVEYCLRGGYYGRDLMFNCFRFTSGEPNPMVLVDGLQRLTAVRKFIKGELAVFNGAEIEDMPTVLLKEDFVIHVHSLPGLKAVYQWYLELNQEGTPHSKEELDRVVALHDNVPIFYTFISPKGKYLGSGYSLSIAKNFTILKQEEFLDRTEVTIVKPS